MQINGSSSYTSKFPRNLMGFLQETDILCQNLLYTNPKSSLGDKTKQVEIRNNNNNKKRNAGSVSRSQRNSIYR